MNQSDIAYTRAFVPQYRTITDAAGRPIARGIQAVIQHFPNSAVYGLLYLDEQAIRQTLATRFIYYYDVANDLTQGLHTGNEMWKVADIYTNCNQDCLLCRGWHEDDASPWQVLSEKTPLLFPALNIT